MKDPTLYATTQGERGSWVVFCHGLFGQGKNWTQMSKTVAERHRVLLLDMPQHGRSPWTDSFTYLDAAEQVAATIGEHAGDDPVALVGHSMGGKIAMVLALRHPEQVARLCVVDVAPVEYASGREFVGYVGAMRALDLSALESRGDADAALTAAVPDPTVRSFLLQNLRRSSEPPGWVWQPNLEVLDRRMDAITGWPADELVGVAPYTGPVLWVRGDRSEHVLEEHGDLMSALFPRVRRLTVRNAGHWVHSEQPAAFASVLEAFLAV
ncbi:MAG: alpha/beta fold hydrolase [Nocardioides sp.]